MATLRLYSGATRWWSNTGGEKVLRRRGSKRVFAGPTRRVADALVVGPPE